MRTLSLTLVLLAAVASLAFGWCATTADVAKRQPYATFSSTRPMPAVMSCMQKKLDMLEWGLCTKADARITATGDNSELVVEGPRGVDAILDGQVKGERSVYELRVARQADWSFCSMSGTFKALAQMCM